MNLQNKIWITRKTRIYSEQRLKRNALISEIFIITFSLILVFLSIWDYAHPNKEESSFLLICGAISLFAVSLFLSSQKFIERALAMRNCYVTLDELYKKASGLKNDANSNLEEEIQRMYNTILLNVENHSNYDFLCFRHSMRNDPDATLPPFTWIDHLRFLAEKTIRIILVVALFISPFLLSAILMKMV